MDKVTSNDVLFLIGVKMNSNVKVDNLKKTFVLSKKTNEN